MTEQGARSRQMFIAGVVLALVAAAAVYLGGGDPADQEQQVADAMRQVDKGVLEFQQKKYQESLDTLGSIPEDVLQHWRINYFMGSSHIMLGDYDAAVAELEKATALNPTESKVLYALGVAYYKQGNLGLSKAYFGKVLEVDPGHDDARGLMDIVANLEREQLEGPPADAPVAEDGASEAE